VTQSPTWSATLSLREEAEFVPVVHELIGIAMRSIGAHFLRSVRAIRKHDGSPVTQADRRTEQAMRAHLRRRAPSHGVLGEEYGAVDGASHYRWVLDPIDGTKAFITNCFLFGSLIALERNDGAGFRPVLGAILHPAAGVALIGHRRRTRLYTAAGETRVVRVRDCRRLEDATLLTTTHWSTGEQKGGEAVERLIPRVRQYRTWGDCFGYFALATGAADVMIDPTLAYWDVAAIVPVVEGAGGRISAFGGGNPLERPSLVATCAHLHDEVRAALSTPH
jgi:histidinol phosphatase-like enzyme (inositol monophosphatase family)